MHAFCWDKQGTDGVRPMSISCILKEKSHKDEELRGQDSGMKIDTLSVVCTTNSYIKKVEYFN